MAPKPMTSTPTQVRALLERNFYYIDDDKAAAIGNRVIMKAKKIVQARRGSILQKDKAEAAMKKIKVYAAYGETSFAIAFQNTVLGNERFVSQEKAIEAMTEEELADGRNFVPTAWEKDNLAVLWQQDFLKDQVPQPSTPNDHWNEMLMSVPRVQTPRPDTCFGITYEAFGEYATEVLCNNRLDLAGPKAYIITFAIEAKGLNESIYEGENQCLRVGATMVNNRRQFNIVAAKIREDGESSTSGTFAPGSHHPRKYHFIARTCHSIECSYGVNG